MQLTRMIFQLDKKAAIKNGQNLFTAEARGDIDLGILSEAAREWLASESSQKEVNGLVEVCVMGFDYRIGIGQPTADALVQHMEACALLWATKKAKEEEEERGKIERLRAFILGVAVGDLLRLDGHPKRWSVREFYSYLPDYVSDDVISKVRSMPEVEVMLIDAAALATQWNAQLAAVEEAEREQKRLDDERKAIDRAKVRAAYEDNLLHFVRIAQSNAYASLFEDDEYGSLTSEGECALARHSMGYDSWVESAERALTSVVIRRLNALGVDVVEHLNVDDYEETTHPSIVQLDVLKRLRAIIDSDAFDVPLFECVNLSNAELCHTTYKVEGDGEEFTGDYFMIEWSFAGLDRAPIWIRDCDERTEKKGS